MTTSYEKGLEAIALANEDVIVMTAENRAAIRNLPQSLGERFIDVGICEQTLIGAAAGLALRGRVPVVHALASFLTLRALEFIRTDIGIAHLPVKMIGGLPGFLSEANGPTHQALEDVALMRNIPGMQIFCPTDEQELVNGLPEIIESPSPCYVRLNLQENRHQHNTDFQIGKAEVVAHGSDVTLLVYGFLFQEALGAGLQLERDGISVRLINLRMLEPVDEDIILESAQKTTMLVTLEDHFQRGGLFSIVCELLVSHRVVCDVLPISFDRRWFKPALLNNALEYEGFTSKQIADLVLRTLQQKGSTRCQTQFASMNNTRTSQGLKSTTLEPCA